MKKVFSSIMVFLIIMSAFSTFVPQVKAQETYVTIQQAKLPIGLSGVSSVWTGKYIYVFGGAYRPAGVEEDRGVDTIFQYDPFSDTLMQMSAKLPRPTWYTQSFYDGNYIYILEGAILQTSKLEIWRYDLVKDEITVMSAKQPYFVVGGTGVWTGEYLYCFGGYDGYGWRNDIFRYNPKTDTVNVMGAKLPYGISAIPEQKVYDGRYIYIFGGISNALRVLDSIIRYDTLTDKVDVMGARLPTARFGASAVYDGKFAYIFGGSETREPKWELVDEILRYDPSADKIDALSVRLPEPLAVTSAVWTGESAYLIGGVEEPTDTYSAPVDTIIKFTPVVPDFEISIIPQPAVIVHVGGWNDSIPLLIKSINGFSGQVQLSFMGPAEANININFSPNPVFLNPNEQVMVQMNVSSTHALLSEYVFTVVGETASIKHELKLTINLVGNAEVINNLVRLNTMSWNNPHFSIQQNFLVSAPNGTIICWAQNVVIVWVYAFGRRALVWSIFQVFSAPTFTERVLNEKRGVLAFKSTNFPVVLNVTSYIDDAQLVLENNASRAYNVAHIAMPRGSYIISYPGEISGSPFGGTIPNSPEIVVVGGAFPLPRVAVFRGPVTGLVDSRIKLVRESEWRSTRNVVLVLGQTQTGENSRNLKWYSDGNFHYAEGSTDQGLSFSPLYDQ